MMFLARLPYPRWAIAVTVLALAGVLGGFRYAYREHPLATLEQTGGKVERDHRATLGRWEAASRGASFVFGDGVKTGPASQATLALWDASKLKLEPRTTVRFLERPSARVRSAKLDVLVGGVTFEADENAVELEFALGTARLEPHTKLRLTRSEAGLELEVMIGSARLLEGDEVLELELGKAIEIRSDRTLHEVASTKPPAPPAGANADEGPAAASSSQASAAASPSAVPADAATQSVALARGPDVADFTAPPGDSFVIHDAAPPTTVAFSAAACPEGAARLTLLAGQRPARETFGTGRVSASIPAGTYRYTFECAAANGDKSGQAMRGTLTVLADAGTRKLPKTIPATSIDADGRSYTVLYQSLLPKISVTWPNAPESSSFTLSVTSSNGTRSFTSSRATYAFSGGMLGEGEHSLSFEGAGRRSRRTELSIHFDNAAPTASISSPSDGSFAPGSSVLVSGAALPGWKVSVAGHTLEQDAQQRFSQEITAPAGQPAFAIRFSHPTRGVHYYLKRSAGR